MLKHKYLNLLISILVVASLIFGANFQVSAQQQTSAPQQIESIKQGPVTPQPPQTDGETQTKQDRVTPAERQAAADRNTALGLLPGLAQPAVADPRISRPSMGMPDPSVVPHYFGPFANYANSPLPKGSITGFTMEKFGSGYSDTPNVTVYDVYGTGIGAIAEAVVVGGAITQINVIDGGTDYSAPLAVIEDTTGVNALATPTIGDTPGSLNGGIRKFVDSLPGLGVAGANNLLNYIPVATADILTYPGSDYYEIELGQYTQQLHSDLPPTTLRGYRQTNMGGTPFSYLGPTIVALKDRPVRIKFTNSLDTGTDGDLFLPVDTTVMGAGEGALNGDGQPCNRDTEVCAEYSENRGTLHLHGGLVPWISDGTPHQWTTPAGENTQYPTGVSVEYVPDMWFDTSGNVIPNTVGQTTPPVPGATNNPSGPASIDGEGAMTFYYNNQQSARLQFYHDHAYGITRLNVYAGEAAPYVITDEIEQDLINGTNNSGVNPGFVQILPGIGTPLVFQDKTFVDATTIAAQDPTWKWGTGALVGGRREPNSGDLWLPSVYMPVQNPWDLTGGANAFGRWQYGPWFWPPTENITYGPVANEYYDPGCNPDVMWCEPPYRNDSPTPSMGMEAYMDTPLVNGTVYPYLDVEPKAYRFRILSGANDRFFNLSMFVADDTVTTSDGRTNTEVAMVPALANPAYPANWPSDGREGGAPDPANLGPDWIQIGTEGGFLPAPVVIPPQPVTWQTNPGFFNATNVLDHSLLLGPAERADVIVDFSQFAGKTIIVYNDAPTAFPALDPRYDYYTGNPSQMDSGGAPTTQPGYGPNTRTVMQIRVANTTPAAPYDLDALNAVFAKGPAPAKRGVFEKGSEPIIVPQAGYNSAYNASFPSDASQYVKITDRSMTFTPMGSTIPVTITFQEKAIHDEMGASYDQEFGRMSGNLGLEIPGSNNLNQNIILYGYASPPVDFLVDSPGISQIGTLQDGTTLWKITHNGVDTHPIHIHLANAQLINRVGWDGLIIPPDANELGWKETIRVNPLESAIWAVRPVLPVQPFDIPNSERLIDPTYPDGADLMGPPGGFIDPALNSVTVLNHLVNYGWEYVWHCHVLSHEEMDMMHSLVLAVTPAAPSGLTASGSSGTVSLQWTDNSVNESDFTIQRSTDGVTWTNIVVPSTTKAAKGGTVSYSNTGLTPGTLYLYRVLATNTVGDTAVYTGIGFPTVTKNSDPSNTAANLVGVTSIVRANPNPTSAASVNFTVTFSENVTLDTVGFTDFATSGTVTGPAITAITGSGAVYTVTVNTGTGSGTLGLNMTNALLGGPYTTGELYTVDKAGPAVLSVVRTTGFANPSSLTGVNFTVTFNMPVMGVDVADFSVVPTGLTGASVNSVAGSGAVYTVTALTGIGTGSLGLNVTDNDTILGGSNTPLGGSGPGNGSFTGEFYGIDTAPPTVVSSVRVDASPTNAANVSFTVTFSELVTGVDSADFNLFPTVTGASITSVTPVSGTTYTVLVNTGTGAGTLHLNVMDNNSIKDAILNPLGGLGVQSYSAGQAYTINKTLPTVISSTPASPNPTKALSVNFTVTFSETVTGVDSTDFGLTATGITGESVTSVTPVSGTIYTVAVNTGTGDGTLRLNIVGSPTIQDLATNALSGPYLGGETYTVDKTLPTVSSILFASPNPNGSTSVDFTVTFSEIVTGVASADFDLTTTGITGESITSVTPVSGTTYTVAVNTGLGDGTLRLNIVGSPTIQDLATNALIGPYLLGDTYTINKLSTLVVSPATGTYGGTSSLTATLTITSGGAGLSGKTISFSLNGGTAVTAVTNGSGIANVPAASLAGINAGVYPSGVVASFAGDLIYGAVSDTNSLTVAQAAQTITVNTAAPVSAAYDSSFTVAATASSGLPVTYSATGACTNSGADFTMNSGTGTCTVHYNQAGDTNFNAALEVTQATTAQKINQTITVVTSAPASADHNSSFTVAATASSALPVDYSASGVCTNSGANFTMTSGIGTCIVHYNQAGNVNYNAALEVTKNTIAQKADQTITVSTNAPVSANYNSNFTVLATGGGSGNPITYSASGGVCTNVAGTFTMTSGTGTCTIHYNQAGNANYNSAVEVTEAVTAQKLNSTTVITSDNPALSRLGQAVTVNFRVTPTGGTLTGNVTVSDGIDSCTAAVADGTCTITMTTNGARTLTATYEGNINFNGSSGTRLHMVDGIPPSVSSITLVNLNPTNLVTVDFNVTYSESVTGVDMADFNLTTSGSITGAAVSAVTGGPTIYTVTVNTGTGSGTLRLDVVDNDAIMDLASNPLGGVGAGNGNFTTGQSYNVRTATFGDVPVSYWVWQYIERLYNSGVTGGCSTSPLMYCPDAVVTRAQMAVFILRGEHGPAYTPPAATGTTFGDVPAGYWAAAWIEQLATEGITGGCGSGNYCPDAVVTRAQMAIFLLRARHGSSYAPPLPSGVFTDVPATYWAATWIEQLSAEGITGGCGGGNFCPDIPVTRAQMAVFLVKTFNLP